MKTVLLSALLLYLLLAAMAYFLADRLIFLPPPSSYSQDRLPVELVPGEDGSRIATLHLPHPDAHFTIIYSHGNAEDIGHLRGLFEGYREAGFSVIGYDYRGYGVSTGGAPTATAASRDLRTVYAYAIATLGIPPAQIILLGRSVGSGPAIELAATGPVGGLIIEGGFVSAFRVVTRIPLLPFDRFPNLRHIRDVRAPVLIIHAVEDEVIPIGHGRRLFEAAPGLKQALWVEGAGHNDLVRVAGTRYWQTIQRFAEMIRDRHRRQARGD